MLCFRAGERRGEQNTHGSGKKTHATKALKICVVWHFWCLFFVPQPQKSPHNDLPEPLRDPPRDPPGGKNRSTCRSWGVPRPILDLKRGPKWHPKSLKNRPRRPRPAQERPRAAGRPKKTPPGGPNSRPSKAHKHTKKLYENTGQKVFPNRFTQDPPTILGSVAGIGGAAPLEIRPLSR